MAFFTLTHLKLYNVRDLDYESSYGLLPGAGGCPIRRAAIRAAIAASISLPTAGGAGSVIQAGGAAGGMVG